MSLKKYLYRGEKRPRYTSRAYYEAARKKPIPTWFHGLETHDLPSENLTAQVDGVPAANMSVREIALVLKAGMRGVRHNVITARLGQKRHV